MECLLPCPKLLLLLLETLLPALLLLHPLLCLPRSCSFPAPAHAPPATDPAVGAAAAAALLLLLLPLLLLPAPAADATAAHAAAAAPPPPPPRCCPCPCLTLKPGKAA